jgi:hypothetical protein
MNPRQHWSQEQRRLHELLARKEHHAEALQLFLRQHAMVHSAALAGASLWSFEDEVLDGLSDAEIRQRVDQDANSIAWLIWHIARIEDVIVNVLIAGAPQVFDESDWVERLGLGRRDIGTSMSDTEVADFSARVAVEALRPYRFTVGRRTRDVISALPPEVLSQRVDAARVQRLLEAGALAEAAADLAQTWGGWKIAGLLTMPLSRHNFTHLNQARRIRQRLRK